MSLRALTLAVVDLLRKPTPQGQTFNCRTNGGIGNLINPLNIGVRPPPGRPTPVAGEVYVAVWCPSWSNRSVEGLVEEYGVNITITKRAPVEPDDRYQNLMTGWPTGLWAVCEAVRACVHLNYNIIDSANAYIDQAMLSLTDGQQTTGNHFVEPLYLVSGGTVEEKGGSWFKANQKEPCAALVQTLQFQPSVRAQDASTTTI